MIDHELRDAYRVLIIFSLVAGLTWTVSWIISLPFRRHRFLAKLCAMSLFAALWVAMTLPMTGRGSIQAGLPYILAWLPWWVAMIVGEAIRTKSERLQNKAAHDTARKLADPGR